MGAEEGGVERGEGLGEGVVAGTAGVGLILVTLGGGVKMAAGTGGGTKGTAGGLNGTAVTAADVVDVLGETEGVTEGEGVSVRVAVVGVAGVVAAAVGAGVTGGGAVTLAGAGGKGDVTGCAPKGEVKVGGGTLRGLVCCTKEKHFVTYELV